jgi:hypothetical protein
VLFWVQDHSTLSQEGLLEVYQSFISTLIAGPRSAISLGILSNRHKSSGVLDKVVKFSLQVSSVLYLDSPSGVGLSYSKNVSYYETGDIKTAADSHTFLLKVIHIKMLFHLGAVMYHLFVE